MSCHTVEIMESMASTSMWGYLAALNPVCHDVKLQSDVFTAGRDRNCTYCFKKKDFVKANKGGLFSYVSRKHFKIFKVLDESVDGFSVYFETLSSHPNYVNNSKIVRGQKVKLRDGSVDALGQKLYKAFRFFAQGDTSLDTDSDSGWQNILSCVRFRHTNKLISCF